MVLQPGMKRFEKNARFLYDGLSTDLTERNVFRMPADMKEIIANATVSLLFDKEKSSKKLTVRQIVEECHITRQTFYYHFEDIPHLLQWIMIRGLNQMRDEALEHESAEEQLRYFLVVSIQIRPYLERTYNSSYAAELEHLMRGEVLKIAEEVAHEQNLYQRLSRDETRTALRYHAHALIGIVRDWTDADTQNLDQIVHTIYRIMSGQISIYGETDNPVPEN